MIVHYTLTCGHVVHLTASSLEPLHKRPRTPKEWWCRTCDAHMPVRGRNT